MLLSSYYILILLLKTIQKLDRTVFWHLDMYQNVIWHNQ